MAFSPEEAVLWKAADFDPKTAQRWYFCELSVASCKVLKGAHWDPDTVFLWGPFKEWTTEEATKWMSNGYTSDEMKYWIKLGLTLEDAKIWQTVGVTTQIHKTLGEKSITLTQWELWRHTNTLAEAAA